MAECARRLHALPHGVGGRPLRPEHTEPRTVAASGAGVGCDLGRVLDDHARRDDRERRAAGDRCRPRRGAADRAMGRRRIHRRIRVAASSRRLVGRQQWRSHRLSRRADRVRPGQRGMRRRRLRHVPDRRASRAGHGCRLVDAELARPDHPHLRGAPGAWPGACRLGRRVRNRSGERPPRGRDPRGVSRLAGDLPRERPCRACRRPCSRPTRGRDDSPAPVARSARPTARDVQPGGPHRGIHQRRRARLDGGA